MSRLVFLAVVLVLAASRPAAADLLISIDRSNQRMTVVGDKAVYMWPVSTGVSGFETPAGSYRALRMKAEHYSKEWDDAPMPHSIFFTERGHAIHGTSHTRSLGAPASHGCVRLAPEHAAFLFKLVEAHGLEATRIQVIGPSLQVANNDERDRYQPLARDLDVRPIRHWLRMLEGLARR